MFFRHTTPTVGKEFLNLIFMPVKRLKFVSSQILNQMLFFKTGLPQFLHSQYPKDLQILTQTGLSSNAASKLELQPHFPATPSCCEAVPPCEEMSVENNKIFTKLPYHAILQETLVNWILVDVQLIVYANKSKCTCFHVH
jgi:hypothetical protein